VTLEDGVFCGPSCVFTNDPSPRAQFPSGRTGYLKTRVKQGASIGANATIVCGHDVGESALVAAGAVVTHDVDDFALVAGVPARRVGWVCVCGQRLDRHGELPEGGEDAHAATAERASTHETTCPKCKRRYQLTEGKLRLTCAPPRP
jgi:UDP-2-acetamido-3-amino-2,3-dideoxy-glucuronate N-acetyltransferase